MAIHEHQQSSTETSGAAWISVHVTHEGKTIKPKGRQPEFPGRRDYKASPRLFENAAQSALTLSERFPRLTLAMIALALVAFTVTVEIEYLRVAGYYWR